MRTIFVQSRSDHPRSLTSRFLRQRSRPCDQNNIDAVDLDRLLREYVDDLWATEEWTDPEEDL